MSRQKTAALAKRLGVTLDDQRPRHARRVTIYLPAGMVFDKNPGLDVPHHECELDENIWPGVIDDLEAIETRMREWSGKRSPPMGKIVSERSVSENRLARIVQALLAAFLLRHPARAHGFDWNTYHARQDACQEADRLRRECARGLDYCDQDVLQAAQRACSVYTSPWSQEDRR